LFSGHSDNNGTESMNAFSKIAYVIHIVNVSSINDHFKYSSLYVGNVTTEIWFHFVQVLFFSVLMFFANGCECPIYLD